MSFKQYCSIGAFALAGLMTAGPAAGQDDNPVVRISTTYGDFSVELFARDTPATVENFLGYVERGDYQRSFIHRAPDGDFVVQGGGYRFIPGCEDGVQPCGPRAIPQQEPVVNESGISNTHGTLAMAKLADDPDSATSQWFVNAGDNSEALDEENGGFTVFGRVLGDGMEVVDRINELPTYNLCNQGSSCYASEIPLRAFEDAGRFPADQHFVHINPSRVSRFSTNLHVFEPSSGTLIVTVDGGADLGPHSARLQLTASDPEIVFRLDSDSLIPLGIDPEGQATFDAEAGELRIPSVELNNPDGARVITDVVFRLRSESPMEFVLESWQDS